MYWKKKLEISGINSKGGDKTEMNQLLILAAAGITYVLAFVCYQRYRQKKFPTLAVWGTAFLVYALHSSGELIWESLSPWVNGLGAGLTLGLLLSGSMLIYSQRRELHIISALIAFSIFISLTMDYGLLRAISFLTPIILMFIIFGIGFYKTRNQLIALMIMGLALLTIAGEIHGGYPMLYRFVDACGYLVMLLALSGILK